MRDEIRDAIFEMAKTDPRIAYIGSDLSPGLLERMRKEMPGRAFMEGISEQYCVGMATGLATEGMVPWVETFASFLTRRAFEQIALAAQQNLPLRLLGLGGGLIYAHLAPTHLAIDDVALMRSIPGMTVICPCDAAEGRALALQSTDYPGPIYFRVGWTQPNVNHHTPIRIGRAVRLYGPDHRSSEKVLVLIISTGSITAQAITAARLLGSEIPCRVLHCATVKPLDLDAIMDASDVGDIYTIEEHSEIGGLGDAVQNLGWKINKIGIPDVWPDRYGTRDDALRQYGLQPDQIADRIRRELNLSYSVVGKNQ